MGRLIKLTSRALVAGATLAAASVLTQGLFIRNAEAANPACSTLPGIVYVSGSSAVKPVLAGLGQSLAGTTTIAYFSAGSCVGVQDMLGTTQPATTWTYWDSTGAAQSCDTSTAQAVDLGVSDVYATTCPGVLAAAVSAAGIADFDTFFDEVMEFVVPASSDAHSISAEAAYLTFGFGADGGTRWNNPDLYLIRNQNSGTQAELSKVIKLSASAWLGHDEGGSGQVVNDVKNKVDPITAQAGDPQKIIGIVSSAEADADPADIKKLSYQDYGQTCAYWPDSGVAEKDKAFVRDGHYPAWGPLHVLAKVNAQGVPTSASAKVVIDQLSAQSQATLDIEINANVVPICAMKVTRSSEIGPLSSFEPTGDCSCYFDSKHKTGGAGADCKVCTTSADCTGSAKVCNYGYCEAK
jgi:hypothetical protein